MNEAETNAELDRLYSLAGDFHADRNFESERLVRREIARLEASIAELDAVRVRLGGLPFVRSAAA